MKTYGKVKKYNGHSGFIIGVDGKEYLLLQKEIVEGQVEEKDDVSFVAEEYETSEYHEDIARFVKVLKNNDKKF